MLKLISKTSMLLTIAAVALALSSGCAGSPSKSHVVKADAQGTKFGIGQNPATGMYELQLWRGSAEVVTIPVWFTNGVYYTADVVSRYELSGHSPVFGNVAVTSTLATGSNAVNTAVGGTTPPINANFGTGAKIDIIPSAFTFTPATPTSPAIITPVVTNAPAK